MRGFTQLCPPATALLLLLPSAAVAETLAHAPVPLREQLDEDMTPIPAGMGAVFVPSLTESVLEPAVVVLSRGERVASGRTGERIVLPPGSYEVVIGEGELSEQPRKAVKVVAGIGTTVRPFYGALRVQVVADSGDPVADSFSVRSADGTRRYGPFETDPAPKAPRARTLLLPAGNYVVVLGDGSGEGAGSVAMSVVAGEVIRYRLVTDGDQLLRSEFADRDAVAAEEMWRLRWVLGGSATLSSKKHQLSGFSGEAAQIDAFSRLEAGLDTGQHLALLTFNVNQAFLGLESENGSDMPLRALNNDTEAELLYTYRVAGIVGPYARGIARTALFTDHYLPDTDVSIVTRDEAGNVVEQRTAGHGDKVVTFGGLSPLSVQEGAGLSLTVLDTKTFTLIGRGGVAARQAFYRNGRYLESRSGTTVNMVRLDDNDRLGGEVTGLAGLRLGRAFTYEGRFDSFIPKEQIAEGEKLRPVFRFDNTLALRLTRAASVVYTFSLRRDELALEELQTSQGLALRLSHVVF